MNIRKFALLALSRVRGSKIFSDIEEIKHSATTGKANPDALADILEYASKNIPFYKGIDYRKGISAFPVVNKAVIKNGGKAFMSPCFNFEKLHKTSTSGSTGVPFTVYQDAGKRRRAMADTIAFSELAGFKFGTKLYYLRAWNNMNRQSWLSKKVKNIVAWDNDNLSNDTMQKFLDALERDKSEKSVLIFASSLVALYNHMRENGVSTTAKVSAFITMSEHLPENAKNGIAKLFGTNVVSRYSDCECGIIAQQFPNESAFKINSASFLVEILDANGKPVEDGTEGRIVITDLYNRAMPMIRYDTEDIGVKVGNTLARISGRKVDFIFSANGEMLSPYTLVNFMQRFGCVKQFQFIQNSASDYTMKLVMNDESREPTENKIAEYLGQILGKSASVKFEYPDTIPPSPSGKRNFIINNYRKQ